MIADRGRKIKHVKQEANPFKKCIKKYFLINIYFD